MQLRYRLLTALLPGIAACEDPTGTPRTPSPGALAVAAEAPCPYPLTQANRPIAHPGAPAETATFTDPTAETQSEQFIHVGHQVYIAPFARLEAQSESDGICIEHAANVQDNTFLKVNGGPIHVGEEAIIAHGAQLVGDGTPVSIAHRDACPLPAPGADPNRGATPAERGRQALANALAEAHVSHADCRRIPAFIGFNALNQSAIEDGALLGVGSRLARGVILRAGYSTFPGKSVDTQQEADTPCAEAAACDVRYVTAGDIEFMRAVVHVNECLAKGYTMQYRQTPPAHPNGGPESVRGIGIDPGSYHRCEFNNTSERPTIGYPVGANLEIRDPTLAVSDPDPSKKIRIIGDVRMMDIEKIQDNVSIRADEGEPMSFREEIEFGFANTFHALETTPEDPVREVRVRPGVKFEERVVVHGGGRRTRAGGIGDEPTTINAGSHIGKEAVVFRSDLADSTRVGARALLVAYSQPRGLPPEVIPERCVKFDTTPVGACAYFVEW